MHGMILSQMSDDKFTRHTIFSILIQKQHTQDMYSVNEI